jgi:quercetin dioxygenase-like cupin family protein
MAPRSSRPGTRTDEVELAPSGVPLAPFKASRFTVAPGCCSREDSHSVHEIWMVAQGEGELIYDGRSTQLQAGDVVYFEPPKPHQLYNHGPEPIVLFSIWWKGD